jgi:hypothetical protein
LFFRDWGLRTAYSFPLAEAITPTQWNAHGNKRRMPMFGKIGRFSRSPAVLYPHKNRPTAVPAIKLRQNETVFTNRDGTISTKVLDEDGKVLATVDHNRWSVPEVPQIMDWNYTDNAIEVIEPSGRIVLQIQALSDHFTVQGEWWDLMGNGIRIVGLPSDDSKAVFLARVNNPDEPHIAPIFKYPSSDYLGILLYDPNTAQTSAMHVMRIAVIIYGIGVFSSPVALLILWFLGKAIIRVAASEGRVA